MPDETNKTENTPKKARLGILQKIRLSADTRKHVLTLVMSIVALSSLLLTVTYSWFIGTQQAGSYLVRAEVYEPPQVYIGTLNGGEFNWQSTLDYTTATFLTPVCGNGSSFYLPKYGSSTLINHLKNDYNDEVDSGDDYVTSRETPSGYTKIGSSDLIDYIQIADFSIKTNFYGEISLADTSAMIPAKDVSPMSYYLPDVSTGYIAGALRVAIAQKISDTAEVLKCVWIPNASFEYNAAENTFTATGEIEKQYEFVSSVGGSKLVINTADHPEGYVKYADVLYVWDLTSCNEPFATFSSSMDHADFRMYVWLEGSDRECDNALSGGKANISLAFNIAEEE